MAKLLIVDDDAGLVIELRDWLRFEKHVVDTAGDAESGKRLLFYSEYDVVILDWQLPDGSGVEILQEARSRGIRTPVIMMTGKGAVHDQTTGLDAGADSYVVKPARAEEISALVRALLRRYDAGDGATFTKIGDLEVSSNGCSVRWGNEDLKLTKLEFACLKCLADSSRPISTEAILRRVWAGNADGSVQSARQHISQLRMKLEAVGSRMKVEHHKGLGYQLVDTISGH